MKICKVYLRQSGPDTFRVARFSNTTQLSVGMEVPRERVAEWCTMKRVNVDIIGMVEDETEETLELPPVTSKDVQRVDALQLAAQTAAQTMQDTGPGENPF